MVFYGRTPSPTQIARHTDHLALCELSSTPTLDLTRLNQMPADLFDWNNHEAWLAEVPKYAASILTSRIKEKIQLTRPKCWSDDFTWLPVKDGATQFANAFAEHYRHIRAFHGCRPTDFASYFENGLQGQSAEAIEALFLSIFRDLPEPSLQEAIDEFKARNLNP